MTGDCARAPVARLCFKALPTRRGTFNMRSYVAGLRLRLSLLRNKLLSNTDARGLIGNIFSSDLRVLFNEVRKSSALGSTNLRSCDNPPMESSLCAVEHSPTSTALKRSHISSDCLSGSQWKVFGSISQSHLGKSAGNIHIRKTSGPKLPGNSGKSDQDKNSNRSQEPEAEEDNDDIYRVVRNLLLRFAVLSLIFYYFSLPKGYAVSLEEVLRNQHDSTPLRFDRCTVYNTYVQWYEPGAFVSFYYTTIPDVSYFDTFMLPLAQKSHGESITAKYKYTSWSEWGVTALGVLVWVVPLLYVPLLLSSYMRPMMPPMGMSPGGSGSRSGNKMMDIKNSIQFQPATSQMSFRDVVGMYEAKREVSEFVEFLGNPSRFLALGAKIPNGALLLGPPGVGKTLLAKAMAGEAKAKFIACCGSDFVELYAGMGALRVRKLYEQAQRFAPCIVYIDEVDAIGMKRTGDLRGGGQEREHTLNQLLACLDGFNSKANVITIASTNAPVSVLDPALVRPGRLDRMVNIDKPLIKEREELFTYYLEKVNLVPSLSYQDPLNPDFIFREEERKKEELLTRERAEKSLVDANSGSAKKGDDKPKLREHKFEPTRLEDALSENSEKVTEPIPVTVPVLKRDPLSPHPDLVSANISLRPIIKNNMSVVENFAKRMAQICPGFTGADIRNVCNEAAILAARHSMCFIDLICLEKAADRVLAGIEKRAQVLSAFERRVVAHHEAGHAVVGWFLERADPLMKVSIVPRGGKALGYAQYLPTEHSLQTEKEMYDDLCVCLGGRVAELVFFNHLSTGAQDDLTKVYRLAYALVGLYGRVPGLSSTSLRPPGQDDMISAKRYSDETAQKLDAEAKELVDRAFQKTMKIVREHEKQTEEIAQHLLTYELLTRDDIIRVLGARPFRQEGFEEVNTTPSEIPQNHPLRPQSTT